MTPTIHSKLDSTDLRYVVQRLPRDIRELLSTFPNKLYVGGGFVRATIAGETPGDLDLFGGDPEFLLNVAHALLAKRPNARMHKSKNAITIITPNRLAVQFITRWVFNSPRDLVASFDFTVCQSALWRSGQASNDAWASCVGDRFYQDLAARRLYYTSPVREEEAGGSLLRVIKYVKRGYTIQVGSLGRVVARIAEAATASRFAAGGETNMGLIYAGLLREVDPLLVVDGFDVVDDHEPVEGESSDQCATSAPTPEPSETQ